MTRQTATEQTHFLSGSQEGLEAYRAAMETARETVEEHLTLLSRPYSGATPQELSELFADTPLSEEGEDLSKTLREVGGAALANSVAVAEPRTMAHLHCPPLVAALAAEHMISAANQSLDSWDQSPSATILEQKLVRWLCDLFGINSGNASGVFTSGGSQSNLMGLLLARNRYARQRLDVDVQRDGLPPEASSLRVLCSETAHFTIRQSAALLGLGERAVVPVETDGRHRMSPGALNDRLDELEREGLLPFAVVGTAGTTDFGSIDPLEDLADRTQERGLWLHVDAAYGGALILSDVHRHKLAGIERADSLTVDFHKQFYQPVSCGGFLVRDGGSFGLMELHADYLNPEGDEESGIPNLVGRSVQTTRRFDALKLYVSLRATGRRTLATMVERTLEVAREAAHMIEADPELELANEPELGAVVFRYLPQVGDADLTNRRIWERLVREGEYMVSRTSLGGCAHLKLTLLNPATGTSHVEGALEQVKRLGRALTRFPRERSPQEGT